MNETDGMLDRLLERLMHRVRARRISLCRPCCRPRFSFLAACLIGALVACGGDPPNEPTWIRLAEGFEPQEMGARFTEGLRRWSAETDGALELTCTLAEEGDGIWVELTVDPDSWSTAGMGGLQQTPQVLSPVGGRADGSAPTQLFVDDVPYRFLFEEERHDAIRAAVQLGEVTPESFFHFEGQLVVAFPRRLPEVRVRVFMSYGGLQDGRWRLTQNRFAGDGLPVLPGLTETRLLEIQGEAQGGSPTEATLRFATISQSALLPLPEDARHVFRVSLGDELLFEHEQATPQQGRIQWHEVPLPPGASGRLAFEVRGPPASTAFLDPVVGPRDVGRPGARPWGESPPDIIIYLADTFRADNMAAHGGPAGLTPVLDQLAEQSVRYLNAWSPASWTLPAHASLFTGVYPTQHFATAKRLALGPTAETMAEAFDRAGYRTGAVTDAYIVSHRSGFDQGFATWDERRAGLDDTNRRVAEFLAQDDGRPVFLFVQTYGAHTPYQVTRETRRRFAGELDFDGVSAEVIDEITDGLRSLPEDAPVPEALQERIDLFHDLYRGGVHDVDRSIGEFLSLLEETGRHESGYLVFTSDHGEAFHEHGVMGHGTGVWDEHVKIPLLLRGPGLEPRDVDFGASLVDLPRTLSRLAGITPPGIWLGSDLVPLDRERPIFSFLASRRRRADGSSHIAMIHGGRKLILSSRDENALELGELFAAYDLTADPGEQTDLRAEAPGWIVPMETRFRPLLEHLLQPLYTPVDRVLSEEQEAALRAMGYTDF